MIVRDIYFQHRSMCYGHTDEVDVTVLLNEVTFEFARFKDMNEINNYPEAKSIAIAGLKQKDFEYFVSKFADRFEVIHFWKCPYVSDLSALGSLRNVKYITYYWNRRADKLWDFSKNDNLLGFIFESFSKVEKLDGIEKSKSLKELWFNPGLTSNRYNVESLRPLAELSSLESLYISVNKVIDNDPSPLLKIKNLKELSFPSNLFTTEQVAMLTANLSNVESDVLAPYYFIENDDVERNTIITGKGKPSLNLIKNAATIDKYRKQFEEMVEQYKAMQQ